jgi:hypothetical protein
MRTTRQNLAEADIPLVEFPFAQAVVRKEDHLGAPAFSDFFEGGRHSRKKQTR